MTFRHAFLVFAMLGLTLSGVGAAHAQQAQDGLIDVGASAEDADAANNWLKVCDDLEDGRRACIMRQVVLNNGVFTGSFLLRDDPGQESRLLAVAAVPVGVLLPFNLTVRIDGGRELRVPYMLCDPQTCSAQWVINEAYVESLKRGNTLTLTARNQRMEDISVNINLAGFTATYDSETALTIEELNQQATGQNELDQVLQDRAEQLRQEIQGGGETPPAEGEAAPAE